MKKLEFNLLNFVCFFLIVRIISGDKIITRTTTCEPLKLTNGEVLCTSSSGEARDCKYPQEVGTIATYKCKLYFEHYEISDLPNNITSTLTDIRLKKKNQDQVLKCGQNGRWIGLQKFVYYGCREDCGFRRTSPKPLIINGVVTNSTNWPWHVALFVRIGDTFGYICGGTLIKRSAVLTAAHCVSSSPGLNTPAKLFIVVLNPKSYIFEANKNDSTIQIFDVTRVYVSESYEPKKEFQGDIAILQLNGSIDYSDSVSPACLPSDFVGDLNALKTGKLGDVVGFGVDENEKLSKPLKHGKLIIRSHSECFLKLQRTLSESQFCAGNQIGEKWVTVCNGDSGGGFLVPSFSHQKYFVHGIVSTGDSNARSGVCQNYAAFTRVFSFIGWIRDVLEEISGKTELDSRILGLPFVLNGKENRPNQFTLFPPEWKNRVASIQLSNVDIEPDILMESLEYSKTVHTISFTRVRFQGPLLRNRVRLPNLKRFSIDVLRDDLKISEDRAFPPELTKGYLHSLLFFDKDFDEQPADYARIGNLQTNIQITVSIFRLVDISHDFGKISLAQLPLTNEILQNTLQEPTFSLRHFALSSCTLTDESKYLISNQVDLEYLILDQVSFDNVSSILKNFDGLQEFVYISQNSTFELGEINFRDLPKGLKHLALTHKRLATIGINETEISELESLFCDSCLPPMAFTHDSLEYLNLAFPTLQHMVLILESPSLGNESIYLQNFRGLKTAYLLLNGEWLSFKKEDGRVKMNPDLKDGSWTYKFEHLDFVMNRRKYFWSSEGDYIGLSRLSSAESEAFRTGHYKYDSGIAPLKSGYFESPESRLRIIPPNIQGRLKSIELINMEFHDGELPESTKFANRLTRLILRNVIWLSFERDNLPENKAELPSLEEFSVESNYIEGWSYLGYHGRAVLFETKGLRLFPWKEQQEFDLNSNLLQSRIKKVYITHAECVMLLWDKMKQSLLSGSRHALKWLRNGIANGIQVKEFAYKYWDLDTSVLPSNLETLNLNFAVVNNTDDLFQQISALKKLFLINVRIGGLDSVDSTQAKGWVWPTVNITNFAQAQGKSLEYLAFEKVHFRNYRPGISFPNVIFAYFVSCSFENDFIRNLMFVFPNVRRLVIGSETRLGGYLLLQAARLERMESILIKRAGLGGSKIRKKIQDILGGTELNDEGDDQFSYFIIERTRNGSWVQRKSQDDQVKSELDEMKGLVPFGANVRCYTGAAEKLDQVN